MLGAIVGDIVGSRFEFNNHRNKDFDLFGTGCLVTDDSIMSLAVAKAIMEASKSGKQGSQGYDHDFYAALSDLTVKYMQEIGRKYPNCGFGGMFCQWVFSDNPEPYNSFGNGAAMRVSPAGFAASGKVEAEYLAEAVTKVTHNHEEGIKGAKATAAAIIMARQGSLKSEIREYISTTYYPLEFRIDDIRAVYKFNETCQETVPQAIECFLESTSFEDAIRIAISLGGDSDTIGAITGAIAEAYYGIPDGIKEKALGYLNTELRAIFDEWELFAPTGNEHFKVLTKYIGKISSTATFGKWITDTENDGTPEHPIHFPFVDYSKTVIDFEQEFYQFAEAHPQYELTRYADILQTNNLKWGGDEMRSTDPSNLDEQAVLALITSTIRAERFCDGALLGAFEDGSLAAWLKRLKDIDRQRNECQIRLDDYNNGGYWNHYADADDGTIEGRDDASQFHIVSDLSSLNVLDERLYSYDSAVFALTPDVRHKSSEGLINKIKQFVDSIPAAGKAKDYIKTKTEYTPRLDLIPDEIKQALQDGTAEIIPCKGSANTFYLQVRTTIKGLVINGKEYGKNRKIKEIPIGTKQVPTDVAGAMQCLAMQNQLNQISNGLREISEACEFNFGRIIQGQRDDRLAKLLSSRSCFIQALAISDESLRDQLLLQAIRDTNSARAELAFQIKSDILSLGGDKSPKAKDMERMVIDINTAVVAMNNAVQLSLYSYQILGEHTAQLAVVKEHETFVEQVLLKQIEFKGSKHSAWKLICSSGNSDSAPQNFTQLPTKLIKSCTMFIEGNNGDAAAEYLEGNSND